MEWSLMYMLCTHRLVVIRMVVALSKVNVIMLFGHTAAPVFDFIAVFSGFIFTMFHILF